MERKTVLSLIIILMFACLIIGLFNLGILQGAKFRRLSDSNCIRLIAQSGSRGNILDRNGEVIVDNKISYDVMILSQDLNNIDQALTLISRILGIGIVELRMAFKKNFISSSIPVTVAANIELKNAIILGEYKIEEPSIIVAPKPIRHYPYGALAAHVIGYVNEIDRWRLTKLEDYGYKTKDIVGFGGVEEKYDYYLRQEEGGLSVEVNHRGKFMRVLGFQPPRNGKDVVLTLDLKIQKIVEENLTGRKGSVILMDPFSGEILALANYPNFNPAVFVHKRTKLISGLFNDPDAPFLNRAIGSSYPPASVFKIVLASAGLELKKINPATSFVCQGSTMVGARRFSCWDEHGVQDLYQAIAHSCNVFFYKTGLLVGAQNIHDYALKLGLGRNVGSEMAGETSGFIPSPLWRKINKFQNWFDGDTANLSIGQGDCLITPLQATNMLAAFANRGSLLTPYIVKSVGGLDLSVKKKRFTGVPFKKNSFEVIAQGLAKVVSDAKGTGNVLSTLPIKVAGKTGTAQVPRGATHAWFVGFFPVDKPRYAICVFLENGGPGHAASLMTKQIIEAMNNQGLI
ncbi:MAG: penicillin-binding protein 2 [Candidatus Omnitrophica bacterium]|nr:penicillin-binding protein 2 [Candidatus Omnitrophota bacterium]MBU4303360.1 penicillin-binding protein 2 [Candidatus Omnitrophota bacterium]MBU4467576.1 penicillin-binding protein 2 [Candidatus Omnitrophota bacterium]MCG2707231.1 penicillin-binding protein 2 [Candidatus Omnitrophota bacterium]